MASNNSNGVNDPLIFKSDVSSASEPVLHASGSNGNVAAYERDILKSATYPAIQADGSGTISARVSFHRQL